MIWFRLASSSRAAPVMPTAVPAVSMSRTALAAVSTSAGVVTSNSSTSSTVSVSRRVLLLPSAEVARIWTVWLVAVSASSVRATLTVPLTASMAKRPCASSSSV